MPDASLTAALNEVSGAHARQNELLCNHTQLRTGGRADIWCLVEDVESLQMVIHRAREASMSWSVNWPFDPTIVRDGGIRGLVIRLGHQFEAVRHLSDDIIEVGSAAPFAALSSLGDGWWSGLANWAGTPGALFRTRAQQTLRGMIAGIVWVRGRSTKTIQIAREDDIPEIPSGAVLTSIQLRAGLLSASNQFDSRGPLTPGVVFDSPTGPNVQGRSAAESLTEAGLLGTRLQAWRLSQTVAGQVINLGGGRTEDLLMLARGVSARTEQLLGLKIPIRLPITGEKPTRRTRTLRRGT